MEATPSAEEWVPTDPALNLPHRRNPQVHQIRQRSLIGIDSSR